MGDDDNKDNNIFPYIWHLDEEDTDSTKIRIYGLDQDNKNICIHVNNFTPFVYLELPTETYKGPIKWTPQLARELSEVIESNPRMQENDRPINVKLMYKKRLYGVELVNNERKRYPVLFLSFASKAGINSLKYVVRYQLQVPGIPGKIKCKIHEDKATPILQMNCLRDISYTDWIKFEGVSAKNKKTTCDREYRVSWKKLYPIEDDRLKTIVPKPLILSFDIEVYSSVNGSMPKHYRPQDKIFQISCIFGRQGSKEDCWEKYLLTLGVVNQELVGKDVVCRMFKTEADLIVAYTDIIREKNPNIIIGYNIFEFDINYLIERAKYCQCYTQFARQGFHNEILGKERNISWSSSACRNQNFLFLESEGRLFIDLLPLIRRDYKFANYRLKTVSAHFVGETKDPLTAKGIFTCYRIGLKNLKEPVDSEKYRASVKAMSIVGKYCVKDSELPLKIFEKIQGWIGLIELSKVCQTEIFSLFTQGQQLKVFSQVYRNCLKEEFVVQNDGYIAAQNESYTGAYVFLPKPGLYFNVIPEDFTSLYPTIIIAYNICYSTWVSENSTIPESECNVIEWEDHFNCPHDTVKRVGGPKNKKVICAPRRYKFLKSPMGVLPKLLTNLLDARTTVKQRLKSVKKQMENITDGENLSKLNVLSIVYDKQQLALKISANSVSEETPILCMIDGSVVYRTIEELGKGPWEKDGVYEITKPIDNLLVWSDKGFTFVKKIFRHIKDMPLKKVITHTGIVNVTEDHSLLDYLGNPTTVNDISIGSRLMTRNLFLPLDTPKTFEYHSLDMEKIYKFIDKYMEEDIQIEYNNGISIKTAILYGFFFAEGTCGKESPWLIYNNNNTLLKKIKNICEKTIPGLNFIISDQLYHGCNVIYTLGRIDEFTANYRDFFYNKRGLKKVPDIVLSSEYIIRLAFFIGYYAAGEHYRKFKGIIIENKGEIGTAGLVYILQSLGYFTSITDSKNDNTFRIECSDTFGKDPDRVKKILNVPINNSTRDLHYVYDIETENNHFAAGIGNLIVHNSIYGSMGVQRGMLPFMPGAMCTTAIGRISIQKVAQVAQEKYNAELVYGDSVVGDTPLLLRDKNGMVEIVEISELGKIWTEYTKFKPWDDSLKNKEQSTDICNRYEIWTANGWSKIKRVIKHKTHKKIYRVSTSIGSVEVTEDHSLLDIEGKQVKPCQVYTGFKLLHNFPETFREIYMVDCTEYDKIFCKKSDTDRPIYEFYENTKICKECCYKKNEKNLKTNRRKPYFSTFEYINRIDTAVIKTEEAFVWGFFMADGSCGKYEMEGGYKYSWVINNQNLDYLERTKTYLEKIEKKYSFKILDTMKSSNVYKLVASGRVMFLVEKYRKLLYQNGKKIVPKSILNSGKNIQKAFLDGYYIGDGSKTGQYSIDKNIQFTAKNKLTSQSLYYLCKSLGYNLNMRTYKNKENIYIFSSNSYYSNDKRSIKEIVDITEYTEENVIKEIEVYDIETSDGTFGAGIGEMVVKNTDSNYLRFPWIKTPQELWDHSIYVAEEISKLFPKPMKLLFEDVIYERFLILSKKRYMCLACNREGKPKEGIEKKGVLLTRRDNSKFCKDIYTQVVMNLFNNVDTEIILDELIDSILDVYSWKAGCNKYPRDIKDFVVTKSVKEPKEYIIKPLSDDPVKRKKRLSDLKCTEEDYHIKALPSQAQLMLKMQERGENVAAGTRLEYVITTEGGIKGKLFEKIEDYRYFIQYKSVMSIDLLYYVHLLIEPIDELLNLRNVHRFIKKFHKTLENREKVLENIKKYFRPILLEIKLNEEDPDTDG